MTALSPPRSPLPFFVGVGRSGTTLLRSIFDAHSEMAVVNESRFVGWMAAHQSRYDGHSVRARSRDFDTRRFLTDLLDNPKVPSRLDSWGLDPDAIRRRVVEADTGELSEAIRSVYAMYAEHQGKGRYGDKTPRYVQSIAPLSELLPESRFVHLVRDGRDVALAVGEVDFGAANLTQAAHRWARRVRRAEAVGRQLGPSRYRLVRYEDLTASPEAVVADLCGFLELPFDAAMLRYYEQPDRVFAGLDGQAHHERLRLPVTKGLRDWRKDMAAGDVARFETVAGDTLAELGYELSSPPRPHRPGERIVTGLQVAQGKLVALRRAKRRKG